MKFLIFSALTLLLHSWALAQQNMQISYVCTPSSKMKSIKMGMDELKQISQIRVQQSAAGMSVELTAKIISADSFMNSRGGKLPLTTVNEKYSIKELKSGNLVELAQDPANSLKLEALFIHFKEIKVETAGPIPEGTFDATLELLMLTTYPEHYSPQTGLHKIITPCKITVRY